MSVEEIVKRLINPPFYDPKTKLKKLQEYIDWLGAAKAGGKFTYHIGLSPQESFSASSVAIRVYRDYMEGLVYPFSVRKAPHIFEFIVVRSSKKV